MLENENSTNSIHEEQDKEEIIENFEEPNNLKNNNVLDKLNDLQKLIKKELILKKLCN